MLAVFHFGAVCVAVEPVECKSCCTLNTKPLCVQLVLQPKLFTLNPSLETHHSKPSALNSQRVQVLLCVKSMYRERVAGLPPPGPAATHANAAPPSAGNNPSGPHSSCPSVGPKGLQPAGGAATAAGSAQVGVGEADGVGEVDAVSQGGGVGVAPEDAAPRSSGGGGPTRPPLVRTSLTEPPQPVTSWAGGPPPDR